MIGGVVRALFLYKHVWDQRMENNIPSLQNYMSLHELSYMGLKASSFK